MKKFVFMKNIEFIAQKKKYIKKLFIKISKQKGFIENKASKQTLKKIKYHHTIYFNTEHINE